jgi:CRP-like cAMP-binding protein
MHRIAAKGAATRNMLHRIWRVYRVARAHPSSGKQSPRRNPTRRRATGTVAAPDRLASIVRKAFPRCQHGTIAALEALADVRTFHAGDTLVAQGDEGRTVLVLDGHVAFRRTTLDGREVMPRIVSSGQLAALLPIALRPAVVEVVAVSPCRVALLPGSGLWALAEADNGFALDLLEHVLLTFEGIVERLDGLMYQAATRRVARVLEQHAAILFGEAAVLTRAYLPALVGTTPEMTRRVLRILETDGIVARIGGDRLDLLDPARLGEAAAPLPTEPENGPSNLLLAKRRTATRD